MLPSPIRTNWVSTPSARNASARASYIFGMDAGPFGGRLPMALVPPLLGLGFGISRWRLSRKRYIRLARRRKGAMALFLPHKIPLLALAQCRRPAVWEA